MVSTKKWALASAVAAAIALPATALATTAGYFQLGYSTISDGMGGASAALPQDSMIQATNPAGIAFVGSRLDLGVAGFWPFRHYASGAGMGGMPAGGSYGSSTNFFLIPHIGYSQRLSHDNYVGLAMYGNGGMSTNYHFPAASATNPAGGPFYDGQTGVNLTQMFVQATYARRFLRHDAIGLSLIYAYQRFSADGLGQFAAYSSSPGNMTNRGVATSDGVGVKVGGQFQLFPGLSLGAAFSPRMTMSKFSKYSGLFANQGQMDIPANGVVGLAFKPTDRQAIAFDFQRIFYGDVPAVGDSISPLFSGKFFGATNGPGFGWQDIDVYKLGYQYRVTRATTVRAGFAYNNQPIPPSQVMLNVLAPGVIQRHVTLGFTTRVARGQDVSVAAMYGLPQSVYGNAPAGFGGAPIKISMHEYQLEANWGWKF
ncbi:MAG: OmpP1/FadL family transporter [Acidiferrobacter thiooxydans]